MLNPWLMAVRASAIAVGVFGLLVFCQPSGHAESAISSAPTIVSLIFGERDRLPVGIVRLADGSIVVLSVFLYDDADHGQFEIQRIDAAGQATWRRLLSARGDGPNRGPTVATSGIEYRDEASLLDLWRSSSNDDDVLDTRLVASADVEREQIIVADRLLGVWVLSDDGKILWHRHLLEPLGLALLTAVALSNDGSILLGGLGIPVGGDCAKATMMKLNREGQLVWQWRSDHDLLAYSTRVVPLADGGVVVLVDSLNPNRYLAGIGETPCSPFRKDYRRLVWLDRSGHQTHQIDVPVHTYIEGMTVLPEGSIASLAGGVAHCSFAAFLQMGSALSSTASTICADSSAGRRRSHPGLSTLRPLPARIPSSSPPFTAPTRFGHASAGAFTPFNWRRMAASAVCQIAYSVSRCSRREIPSRRPF